LIALGPKQTCQCARPQYWSVAVIDADDCFLTLDRSKLPLYGGENISENLRYPSPSEPQLLDTIKIRRELDASFDEKNCPIKTQPPLEQTTFVNYILSRAQAFFGFVLAGQDQKCKRTRFRNVIENIANGMPSPSTCFVSHDF
jgi:hypothetical protein